LRFLVDICHPGHVHFFRHALDRLAEEGHDVLVTARAKDVAIPLLNAYGIEHCVLSTMGRSRSGLYVEYLRRLPALVRLIRRFRPDLLAGVAGTFIVPAGLMTGTPRLVFTDTEHVAFDRLVTYPWATRICTPEAFGRDLGRSHERYSGFQELAYLHPRRFRPDPSVAAELGLKPGERFSIFRFVSWQASHDRGERGLSSDMKDQAVAALSRHGRVFVSAEGTLPERFGHLRLQVPPHRVHDVLALASVYLGEGATMATEAALLGTPSVYVSSLVGTMGNFETLREQGLVLSFRDGEAALSRAEALLADAGAKAAWQERAAAFVARHVDVADYVHRQMVEVASLAKGQPRG
jgi:predicted glycosyltransferase